MSTDSAVHVNFGKPMPAFPLHQVVMLPQQVVPLHIFEPRYRQMVEHALDGSGQIAMASFLGEEWKQKYHGRPPLKPAVCVGQIVQHEKMPDGRFNLLLQGVCRARIVSEVPADEAALYRRVMLEPVGMEDPETPELSAVRRRVTELLAEGPLAKLAASGPLLQYLRGDDVPTHAVLELVSFLVLESAGVTYDLLAEGDVIRRSRIILLELEKLQDLVRRASKQLPTDAPRTTTWN